jgi:uncharacterized repeat protein (TIGR01451 family)
MKSLLILLFSVITINSFAQVPGINWQRPSGGAGHESISDPGSPDTFLYTRAKHTIKTPEGGFLVAGTGGAASGDIPAGTMGSGDVWIMKLDSARNIVWSKLYGGSKAERFGALQITPDNGYIFTAGTLSSDGDITLNKGSQDFWVVKLNQSGDIQWQKTYGGSRFDAGEHIELTRDGGYIVSGLTSSSDGDVSGITSLDTNDIWVVKLDNIGNLQWQKCYGSAYIDRGSIVKQLTTGNYIIAGEVDRNSGWVTGHHGFNRADIWVAELDQSGNLVWQKALGGPNYEFLGDVEPTANGGFLVVGSSYSETGDVSGNHGNSDAWVIQIGAGGTIQWQKCFGGSSTEGFTDVQRLFNGNYIAVGNTASTNGDVTFGRGMHDVWIVSFTNTGQLLWQKTIGGSQHDLGGSINQLSEYEFVLMAQTSSNNFDVVGAKGLADLWLVKLSAVNIIKGAVFIDVNANGVKDANEPVYNEGMVKVTSNGEMRTTIPVSGKFELTVDTGSFAVSLLPANSYYTVVPATRSINFTTYYNTDSFGFALQPVPGHKDLSISVVPISPARPGFVTTYRIMYKNQGTETVPAGEVLFKKDSRLTVVGVHPASSSILTDTLKWNFANLQPLDSATITIQLKVAAPPAVNNGNVLTSTAIILPVTGDETPSDDTAVLKQIVVGSFDPNDKTENNAGKINPKFVSDGKHLNYVIRFQNTGTDTAFTVVVRDTLDAKIDWNSMQMITASHAYTLTVANGNTLTWQFKDILLPDSNVNEPASHGFIAYRIKPKSTLSIGDTVKNSASIYFDFNLPVSTNIENTVVVSLSTLPAKLSQFEGILKNNIVHLSWKTATEQGTKLFEVERSIDGLKYENIGTVNAKGIAAGAAYTFNDLTPAKGFNYYRLKIIDHDGKYVHSSIVIIQVKPGAELVTRLYPNPSADGNVSLNIYGSINGVCSFDVWDMSGRQVLKKDLGSIKADSYSSLLRFAGLQKGIYTLRLNVAGSMVTHRLVIQ